MRISLCFLACAAVALGVTLVIAAPHPHQSLKEIYDQIEEFMKAYNESRPHTEEYVNSAREFAEGPGRCGKKFFCAARNNLHKHSPKHEKITTIVRSLRNYLQDKHVNCTQALMNTTHTTQELPLPQFLNDIKVCIQCRNLNATSPSC